MNLYPITIIENFYDNPDQIRDYALSQQFTFRHQMTEGYGFPGCRTKDLLALSPALYEKVCKRLISVFHLPQHDIMRWQIATSFQIVEEKYDRGLIHQDDNVIFAGILYLSPQAPLNSGTSIFRKKENFNQERYDQALVYNDSQLIADKQSSYDYHDMFEETLRVNNVYNTLLIFEGDSYHAANQFFGSTKENARMTQTFFINRIDAQKRDSFPGYRVKDTKF